VRPHLAWLLCFICTWPLAAEERVADIRQGTNLGVTISPDGTTLVIELLGQLWTMPVTGGGATPLTPPGERAHQPRYSPDGTQLVYQRWRDGQWDLFLLDIASGTQRALTATPFDERQPEFTGDGRSIVYVGDRTGHFCLWSVTVDGGIETQLTEEDGDAAFPSVSAVGLVAYVLNRRGTAELRVLDTNGAGTTVHTSAGRLLAPTWRPGGGVLVFGEQNAPQSSQLRMLLLSTPRVLKNVSNDEDLFDTRPAWSSSGEIIYAADGQLWRRGLAYPVRRPVHLFAASTVEAYAAPTDLPRLDVADPQPAFGIDGLVRSADGRRAVFSALGDLWLVERNSEPARITDDPFVDADPTFWPDGDSVLFTSERTGQFELWRLTLRERRLTQITFGAQRPRRPAVRPDGKQVAFLEAEDPSPWAREHLRVIDWPSGAGGVLATGLVAAGTPLWSDDGRGVALSAAAVDRVNQGSPIVSIAVGLTAAGTARDATPSPAISWQPPPAPPEYVVQVGRLFDGVRSDYRRHVDVHVRDGKIAAIVGRDVLPARGPIIDARDATMIPGLIDVHTHQTALAGERLGRIWLAYGVTTVREFATNPAEALERAEVWSSGRLPGPRLLVTPVDEATPSVSPSAPVRRYEGIANGFAHSLFRQARDTGNPVLGGVTELGAVPPRPYELEVSPGFVAYQDGFSRLIASATVFTPGLGALAGLDHWPGERGAATRDPAYRTLFNPFEQAHWAQPRPLARTLPALEQTVARLVRGGGRVAIGSEAPTTPYGLGVHLELALLADAGVANDQVLRIATAEGALALGLEQQIGTLEDGKLADFVVLDGDPLQRLSDTLAIVAIAKGGTWYDRSALLTSP
jgi:Tol biopolymer transport system component